MKNMQMPIIYLVCMFLFATVSLQTNAESQCLGKDFPSPDLIANAISGAANCQDAYRVMDSCLFGSSIDVYLAQAVIDKCESDFLKKISQSLTQDYKKEVTRCDKKYENESGSMYVSFAASCRAKVAAKYSELYLLKSGGVVR